jgi:protein SCO1
MKGRIHKSWLFVAAVVILPLAAFGIVHWAEGRYARLPVLGAAGHTISDFRLVDQEGKLTTAKNWNGKIVVAHYFFTHCPVVCPKMMVQLKRVQAYSKVAALQIASFTADPERDSSAQLRKFAGQMGIRGDNWQLITGDKRQLYWLARKSFGLVATEGDGGPDDFIHSDRLALIDTRGRIRGYYDGTDGAAVDRLIADLRKLQNEN